MVSTKLLPPTQSTSLIQFCQSGPRCGAGKPYLLDYTTAKVSCLRTRVAYIEHTITGRSITAHPALGKSTERPADSNMYCQGMCTSQRPEKPLVRIVSERIGGTVIRNCTFLGRPRVTVELTTLGHIAQIAFLLAVAHMLTCG